MAMARVPGTMAVLSHGDFKKGEIGRGLAITVSPTGQQDRHYFFAPVPHDRCSNSEPALRRLLRTRELLRDRDDWNLTMTWRAWSPPSWRHPPIQIIISPMIFQNI